MDKKSFLFITLDSCRYDTFEDANIPNMKKIGPLYKAMAPSYFTFGSHAAMFMGFTPGIAKENKPFLNPKYGKIFKMIDGGFEGKEEFFRLGGENIVDGLNRLGYVTIGTGGVGWFDPNTDTGRILGKSFQHFFYPGNSYSIDKQLEWVDTKIKEFDSKPLFVFMNIGETHVPYYYKNAPWRSDENPCVPFSTSNDAHACKYRQTKCLEFVDSELKDILNKFSSSSILICADHGDCWGEDGLWEHGIHHEMTLTVPLIIKLSDRPVHNDRAHIN